MHSRQDGPQPGRCFGNRSLLWAIFAWALSLTAHGCAAITNPVANGIPVRRVPQELLGQSKEGSETIPLTLLRQNPPDAYLLGPEDVLGIWIEGVLGEKGQAPPIRLPEFGNAQASIGYPIPVRADGTIALPLVNPIKVEGMTIDQAQLEVMKAYTITKNILKLGSERIIVTLQRPRQYHVLVIRQDATMQDGTAFGQGGSAAGLSSASRPIGFTVSVGGGGQGARRGMGFAIDLPAYKNDVLNALAQTGGLPGTEAVNEIIIERGAFKGTQGRDEVITILQSGAGHPISAPGTQQIRIPLRLRPGEQLSLRPKDMELQNGDIVFIKAREVDVFYTAGLLPAGEYVLPRDADLDVVEAITRIGGALNSGGLSTLNISGTLLNAGLGLPSPSLLSVVRKTPSGGQVTIRVDLNRALRDRRERILIQPRDVLVLQERPEEAIARYIGTTLQYSTLQILFPLGTSASGIVTGNAPIGQ